MILSSKEKNDVLQFVSSPFEEDFRIDKPCAKVLDSGLFKLSVASFIFFILVSWIVIVNSEYKILVFPISLVSWHDYR